MKAPLLQDSARHLLNEGYSPISLNMLPNGRKDSQRTDIKHWRRGCHTACKMKEEPGSLSLTFAYW